MRNVNGKRVGQIGRTLARFGFALEMDANGVEHYARPNGEAIYPYSTTRDDDYALRMRWAGEVSTRGADGTDDIWGVTLAEVVDALEWATTTGATGDINAIVGAYLRD